MTRRKDKRITVRAKRLNELNESQLALAVWLIAKNIVEDQTNRPQPNPEQPDDDASSVSGDAEAA